MDALSAMRSLADLQAKFQTERFLSFDPEALLALTAEIDSVSDSPLSPSQGFHATFETSSAAQLFDYRGEKVAGFDVNGIQMICLPQVYEMFLKNMVGGLHTVYTKLKRLEISPLICNVEQVRALRGLGAIQPGVNRCKLIASTDFDRLYEDCTNTCTRPGRPPKRALPISEDWSAMPKKESTLQGEHLIHPGTFPPEDLSHLTAVQNPILLSNFLPQFTAHQLLVQHMIALASQQKSFEAPQSSQNAEERQPDSLPSELSGDVPTPLNLTKTNSNSNSNSDTCDSDSMEGMRKLDSSLSPSQCNSSERGGSSSNGSNSSPTSESSAALNKIITLIDMTNDHFKQQKEALQREREELVDLRTQLKEAIENRQEALADETRLRHQLDKEKKKSAMFFRRYCKAKKEVIELKEQLVASSSPSV